MGDDVELILWLEDDVVLMENFFPTLTSILDHHTEKLARAPWLDIKLYLIPGLRGYAWDPQPLLELISTTALITLILHPTFNRIFLFTDRRRSWLARLIVLFILVLLTLQSISRYHLCPLYSPSRCVFYYRQHIVQWRRIHPQLYGWKPVPSLNTQATVYNRTSLKRIVSYLRKSPDSGPVDLQISKYRSEIGLAGFLLEPNLVRHIGSQSSRYQVRTGDTREFQVNYSI